MKKFLISPSRNRMSPLSSAWSTDWESTKVPKRRTCSKRPMSCSKPRNQARSVSTPLIFRDSAQRSDSSATRKVCSILCRIGSPEILVEFYDGQNNELLSYRECVSPEEVIKHFRLREPRFAQMCRNGLFS